MKWGITARIQGVKPVNFFTRMRILVVMDSVSRAGGGLFDAERCLHRATGGLGVKTSVVALKDPFTAKDLSSWHPLPVETFVAVGGSSLGFSPALRQHVLRQPADLVYRVGLWRLPSAYAYEWSRKNSRPEIIAPHGMLDPWALRHSRWKKIMARLVFEGAPLKKAACIRSLCRSEAHSVRLYGLKNPVCVIPNGVELPRESGDHDQRSGRNVLLFLGRLHPKKGLNHALRAWKTFCSQLEGRDKQEEWQFVIAGWDQCGHEAELKALCQEIGLSAASIPIDQFLAGTTDSDAPVSVVFVGPTFGAQKDQLLRAASAFILPSFSEGLPMSVLEAWAYRLPVLMTDHCNLPEGFAAGAAVRIGTDVESITDGLHEMISATNSQRQLMGDRGRALVERHFTWPQVAAQMKEVYDWVLGGGAKPSCVE